MEISQDYFFLFWAVIGVMFLKLGFNAIDNTELSKSVPPLAMFFFKHSLAIFTCFSSIPAFHFRSLKNKSVNIYFINFTFGILALVSFSGESWAYCFFPIYTATALYNVYLIVSDFTSDPKYKWKLAIIAGYTFLATAFAAVSALTPKIYRGFCTFLVALFHGYASWLYRLEDERSAESLPSTDSEHDLNITICNANNNDKIKKSIEFAVGLLGTILFQNFFRVNSFKQVVAFLYFSVAWLADITLLSPSYDLGVFNFLLGNAIVGCSVSEFGLRGKTWIAYAASVFLYCLRLKIQSFSFVNRVCQPGKQLGQQARESNKFIAAINWNTPQPSFLLNIIPSSLLLLNSSQLKNSPPPLAYFPLS